MSLLKRRVTGRALACASSDMCASRHVGRGVRACERRRYESSYYFTILAEHVGSLNGRLSHHRMVRGQRSSAQKPRAGTHTLAQAPRRAPSRHRGDGARRLSDSLITITASAERVRPLKERLIHHRVIRGHQLSAQTHAFRPRTPFFEAPMCARLRHFARLAKALRGA